MTTGRVDDAKMSFAESQANFHMGVGLKQQGRLRKSLAAFRAAAKRNHYFAGNGAAIQRQRYCEQQENGGLVERARCLLASRTRA